MGNAGFFVSFEMKQCLVHCSCLEFTKWEALQSHTATHCHVLLNSH